MKIKYLVVHCSDTPDDKEFFASDIHEWHQARKWSGIGYHAVILRDGTVEMGRPPYWQGAHVKGHNHESLGVCLIGRDEFTEDQLESLKYLLEDWQEGFPEAEVVGHCDLTDKKTCPNFNVREWYY